MEILITGSSGFLGKHLNRFLEHQGFKPHKINSKNCDLRRIENLNPFSKAPYDLIFHLAAWTQAGDFCLKHPGEQWIINQQINTNVLTWWAHQQPQAKLVCIGTSCAYAPGENLSESQYMTGEPHDSLYTYAMTKRMLYQGVRAINQQFGLRYLYAIPSTLYGTDYHTDARQPHFIFDLIKKIIRGKKYGEPVVLWGDGYQQRELVLVDDFIRILWQLIQRFDHDLFNIGAGEQCTIRFFAKLICDIVGYPHEHIQYDTQRYVGARSKCLKIEKAKAVLGHDYRLTPLSEGLAKTIDWFYRIKADDSDVTDAITDSGYDRQTTA
jgi:GDP-L-fucose synthase